MPPTSYNDFKDAVEQRLQDASNAEFTAADVHTEIEYGLQEYGTNQLHEFLVPVIFKIESRFGQCSSTSSSNLTDTSKSQFVSGDATNEKVIHNTTDDTWATVSSFTSTSVLALNADIFVSGERYEIYNKRCRGKRQIYIGDVTDYIRIAQVEYPIGHIRNFKMVGTHILEIDAAYIADSNSTLTTLGAVDVLVWFAKPHVLSQLTDWAGEVNNGAGYAAGITSMAVDGLSGSEVIEEGEVFTLENHRTYYTVTADTTLSAGAGTISFYPGLEAAVVDNDDVTILKSSLLMPDYDNLADLVAGRLLLYKTPKFIRSGKAMSRNYREQGQAMLDRYHRKMRGQTGARTTYNHSRY